MAIFALIILFIALATIISGGILFFINKKNSEKKSFWLFVVFTGFCWFAVSLFLIHKANNDDTVGNKTEKKTLVINIGK